MIGKYKQIYTSSIFNIKNNIDLSKKTVFVNIFTNEDIEIFNKIKDKLSWKHSLLLLIPVFFIYPKPFLYILSPFIKRIKKYNKPYRARISKIILTINKNIKPNQLIQGKIIK